MKIFKNIFLLFFLFFAIFFLSSIVFSKSFELTNIIAYPNPFDPKTENLTIAKKDKTDFDGSVKYIIYDLTMKKIYEDSVQNSKIIWNGHNKSGQKISSGIYFIKLIQTKSDKSIGTTIIKILIH
ncbi:MAG: T9SS type A sorting domain-containing protein [Spirochaetia bacterium]|nr:T9SS type A sorting domain-containing protein [Spirochaetia bacterium]